MATTNPFDAWSSADLWRPWLQLAPASLVQPVLSGWTLNINSNNSTSPQTEADVVAKHSYGRQLGRISDALRALLRERHPAPPETGPLGEFLSMCDEIDDIKAASAAKRLEQVAADLQLLKRSSPDDYERVRAALERALERSA